MLHQAGFNSGGRVVTLKHTNQIKPRSALQKLCSHFLHLEEGNVPVPELPLLPIFHVAQDLLVTCVGRSNPMHSLRVNSGSSAVCHAGKQADSRKSLGPAAFLCSLHCATFRQGCATARSVPAGLA